MEFVFWLIVAILVVCWILLRKADQVRKKRAADNRAQAANRFVRALEPTRRYADSHPELSDRIAWNRTVHPPELYRVSYADRNGEYSEREISVVRLGSYAGHEYVGAMEAGKFKSFRADRLLSVEQISTGHARSIRPACAYSTVLPSWPTETTIHRVPTTSGNRHWTVDLKTYSCTCPEKRVRAASGQQPGTLGMVCPHLAEAITGNLPQGSGWSDDLLAWLHDPGVVNVAALF